VTPTRRPIEAGIFQWAPGYHRAARLRGDQGETYEGVELDAVGWPAHHK
jgi:hypothetical protein